MAPPTLSHWLLYVEVPVGTPYFFSSLLERPKRLVVVVGMMSFFSSGFAGSLFVEVVQQVYRGGSTSPSGETTCSLGDRYRCPGCFWFLGATEQPTTERWCRRRGRRRSGSTVCRFGGSPNNPPGAGAVIVVVVDESPAGWGGGGGTKKTTGCCGRA